MSEASGSGERAHPEAPPPAPVDDRGLRWLGMLIVLVVFGGFGAWAAFAPLSSAAHAPGVMAVESYRKTVQHLEGGIVKAIHVRDGEVVEKDQALMTLEDTQPRAQVEVLRGQYLLAVAREARLLAQRDGLTRVVYPNELIEVQSDQRVGDAMRVQEQTFLARKAAYEGEISLYEQQIGQLQARAAGFRSQRDGRELLVHSYRAELDDFRALQREGFVAKQRVREFERQLANAEGQLGDMVSGLAAVELQTNETRLKILQLRNEMQREVAKELSEVQSQLSDLREKLISMQDTLARTVVRAPDAGTVLDCQVHTVGAVIRPGAKLLDIVPQGERLIVEARVSPMDIDRLRTGQTAEIRFSSFKMRDTPRIDGELVTISPDRLVDAADPQKLPYYLARVQISARGLLDLSRHKLALVAGMPVEVLINTGERTLFNYLLDPLLNTAARAFIED